MRATETQTRANTKPMKIATPFAQSINREFHSLMHHINVDTLRACFEKLDGKKAIGADGINKEQYENNLQNNLENLIERMKRMAYRPGPVRQVLIPKEGKTKEMRELGVSNLEDKLVQMKIHEILERIYEPMFLPCSYGFRPGIGCHGAIKDLHQYLFANEVETVLDVDVSNYFGSINREHLKKLLQQKIKDTRFLRYISRMFKAGVLSEGEIKISEEGVVQGSCCSPILANVYAHYVMDTWFDEINRQGNKGAMKMYRFADDIVMCFRYEQDAIWMKEALTKRLKEFDLTLNEDKTKMVKFSKKQAIKGIKQDAFDFLGFTFYLGRSRKGTTIPKLKTNGLRMRGKLKRVKEWARNIRNRMSLKEIWKIFCSKLRGHIQYYGISFNIKAVSIFRTQCVRIMFKWLNRRSQRKSFDWGKFERFMARFPVPAAKIYHSLL